MAYCRHRCPVVCLIIDFILSCLILHTLYFIVQLIHALIKNMSLKIVKWCFAKFLKTKIGIFSDYESLVYYMS